MQAQLNVAVSAATVAEAQEEEATNRAREAARKRDDARRGCWSDGKVGGRPNLDWWRVSGCNEKGLRDKKATAGSAEEAELPC